MINQIQQVYDLIFSSFISIAALYTTIGILSYRFFVHVILPRIMKLFAEIYK